MRTNTVRFRRLVVTAMCLALAVVFGFLVSAEESPLHEYFLWHVKVPNVWWKINLPAMMVGIAVSHNVHQPDEVASYVAFIAQWSLIGYLFSLFLVRRPPANRSSHEPVRRA